MDAIQRVINTLISKNGMKKGRKKKDSTVKIIHRVGPIQERKRGNSVLEIEMKQIEGYPHLYACSNGEIYSTKSNRYLKGSYSRGYHYVSVAKGKMLQVHRLIAKAFILNPNDKEEVNHINGNKADNRVENLEWVSHTENQQHALKNGLRKTHSSTGVMNVYPSAQGSAKPYRYQKGSVRVFFNTLEEAIKYRNEVDAY